MGWRSAVFHKQCSTLREGFWARASFTEQLHGNRARLARRLRLSLWGSQALCGVEATAELEGCDRCELGFLDRCESGVTVLDLRHGPGPRGAPRFVGPNIEMNFITILTPEVVFFLYQICVVFQHQFSDSPIPTGYPVIQFNPDTIYLELGLTPTRLPSLQIPVSTPGPSALPPSQLQIWDFHEQH